MCLYVDLQWVDHSGGSYELPSDPLSGPLAFWSGPLPMISRHFPNMLNIIYMCHNLCPICNIKLHMAGQHILSLLLGPSMNEFFPMWQGQISNNKRCVVAQHISRSIYNLLRTCLHTVLSHLLHRDTLDPSQVNTICSHSICYLVHALACMYL